MWLKHKIEETLERLNGFSQNLKFTVERQTEDELPFLDMRICKQEDGQLKTAWYAKPYSTKRMLNFLSRHSRLVATAKGFMNRVVTLTDKEYLPEAVREIVRILQNNNYPKWLIDRLFDHWMKGDEARMEQKEPVKYMGLTYVHGYTELLGKIFKNEINVVVAPRARNTVRSGLPTLKDPIDKNMKSNVIYSIPCTGCEDVYIGQTKRYLGVRMQEHEKSVEKVWAQPELGSECSVGECAIIDHYRNTEHVFDFENVKILETESHLKKRLSLESLCIMTAKRTCNWRTDTKGMSKIYTSIISNVKERAPVSRRGLTDGD